MTKEINNCQDCGKSLIVNQVVNESTEYQYYFLSKENDNKKVCLNCWEKNQEQYKQDWEDIVKREEHWRTGGVCNHYFDHIQAKCTMKNCGKKFDCKTAEEHRHDWSQNSIDTDEHEELNKNPASVKTMEDLVKQWMVSMGHQKVYLEEGTMKIKKADGKVYERWVLSTKGWNSKLEEWLKEQPNKSIEVKAEREREREREREQDWGTTETNCWIRGYN